MAQMPDYKALIENHGFAVMAVDDLKALVAHAATYGGTHIVFDRASRAADGVKVSGDDPQDLAREVAELQEIADLVVVEFEVGDVVSVPTGIQYTNPEAPDETRMFPEGTEFTVVSVKYDSDGPVYELEPTDEDEATREAASTTWNAEDDNACGPLTLVRSVDPDEPEISAPGMGM